MELVSGFQTARSIHRQSTNALRTVRISTEHLTVGGSSSIKNAASLRCQRVMGSKSPSRTSLAGRYGIASWNPGLYHYEACSCIFTRGRCSVVKDTACITLEKSLKVLRLCPHLSGELVHRSFSKTLSKPEEFKNANFAFKCGPQTF